MAKTSGGTRSGSSRSPNGVGSVYPNSYAKASVAQVNQQLADAMEQDAFRAWDMTQSQIDSEIGYRNIESYQYNDNGSLAVGVSNLPTETIEINVSVNGTFDGIPRQQQKGIQKMIDIIRRNGRDVSRLVIYRE